MDQRLKARVQEAGYEILYDPPKDGNCFYSAAAFQLGLSCKTVKNAVFNYLRRNQIDVSVDFPPFLCISQNWGALSSFSYHGNQNIIVYIAQHFTFL